MANTVAVKDNNTPFSLDQKERVLDVYYTDYGTKIFVKNGVLAEESVGPSYTSIPEAVSQEEEITNPAIQPLARWMPYSPTSPPYVPENYDEILANYKPKPPISAAELRKGEVKQTTRVSKVALRYYNREHKTNYELVDPVSSNGFMWGVPVYHCNFKASESSHDDSSAKLFFAEVTVVEHDNDDESDAIYSITVCCPIDDCETTTCCKACLVGGGLLHPKNVVLQG